MGRTRLTITGLVFIIALLATSYAFAGPIDFEVGTYALSNHPDGNKAPPYYGARLDNLWDDGVFLFDFECADCEMTMVYDGSTIHISGEAFGGHKDGDDFKEDDDFDGMYEWDMTYTTIPNAVVNVENDDTGLQDIGVLKEHQMNAVGTLEFLDGDGMWALTDKAGKNPYSFRVGDEDDDMGHRPPVGGFPEGVLSGWGWMMFSPIPNVQALTSLGPNDFDAPSGAQDFLFTAKKVPVPAPAPVTLLLFGLAALGVCRKR